MKLINLLKPNEEITCFDTDYDMEFYMEKLDEESDDYNRAMMTFAKCVDIEKVTTRGVTLKVSKLIEKNLEREEFANLFVNPDIDTVMEEWDLIMSGYTSESWYKEFADLLQ